MNYLSPSGVISLEGAQALVASAFEEARKREASIAVAVTGPSGDLRAFARMDETSPLAGETARRKCWTVVLTERPTRDLGQRFNTFLAEEPNIFHGMLAIGQMAAFPGGVPLRFDGRIVGTLAVSGAASDDDHAIAEAVATLVTAS
jgi:uncharacterized protein GlcG (DUF336 family)